MTYLRSASEVLHVQEVLVAEESYQNHVRVVDCGNKAEKKVLCVASS